MLAGFDRHLLGLYLVAKEEGLPTPHLFMDPLYAKRCGYTCSTSIYYVYLCHSRPIKKTQWNK